MCTKTVTFDVYNATKYCKKIIDFGPYKGYRDFVICVRSLVLSLPYLAKCSTQLQSELFNIPTLFVSISGKINFTLLYFTVLSVGLGNETKKI